MVGGPGTGWHPLNLPNHCLFQGHQKPHRHHQILDTGYRWTSDTKLWTPGHQLLNLLRHQTFWHPWIFDIAKPQDVTWFAIANLLLVILYFRPILILWLDFDVPLKDSFPVLRLLWKRKMVDCDKLPEVSSAARRPVITALLLQLCNAAKTQKHKNTNTQIQTPWSVIRLVISALCTP